MSEIPFAPRSKFDFAALTAKFDFAALTATFDDATATVDSADERVKDLTAAIAEAAKDWSGGPLVKALQAFCGIQLVTAATLVMRQPTRE